MNNIITIFAECLIIVRLCNRSLGFKKDDWKLLKSFLFFLTIFSASYVIGLIFYDDDLLFNVLSAELLSLFCFIYSAIFLKGKFPEKLLISITSIIVLFPVKFLVASTFGQVTYPYDRAAIPAVLFSILTYFFACEFIIRIRKRMTYSLSPFQWGIQVSCYIITFLIAGWVWNYTVLNREDPVTFLLVYILIAILNVLLYFMMSGMQRGNVKKEEYRLSRINLAAQEKFVLEARERYSEMRTLRHDMKHYFTAAAELLSDGKYDEARDYIERVLDEKIIPAAVGVSTGSAIIDAVINNKISVCAQNGIEMKCAIDTVFGGNDIDISILLSNLLDNAINGCDRTNPRLELSIETKKSLTFIIVKNSIAKSVLEKNPELKTDNADKSAHGLGVESVRKIAEKHGGSVEFREEGKMFVAEVWLKN